MNRPLKRIAPQDIESDLRRLARIDRQLDAFLTESRRRVDGFAPSAPCGRVRKVDGAMIHAEAADMVVSEIVELYTPDTDAE